MALHVPQHLRGALPHTACQADDEIARRRLLRRAHNHDHRALRNNERRWTLPLRVVVRPPCAAHKHTAHNPLDLRGHNDAQLLAADDRPRLARDKRLLRRGLLRDTGDTCRPLRHDQHLEDSRRGAVRLGLCGTGRKPGRNVRQGDVRRRHGRRRDAGRRVRAQPPERACAQEEVAGAVTGWRTGSSG